MDRAVTDPQPQVQVRSPGAVPSGEDGAETDDAVPVGPLGPAEKAIAGARVLAGAIGQHLIGVVAETRVHPEGIALPKVDGYVAERPVARAGDHPDPDVETHARLSVTHVRPRQPVLLPADVVRPFDLFHARATRFGETFKRDRLGRCARRLNLGCHGLFLSRRP
jgi:hypothetical protein